MSTVKVNQWLNLDGSENFKVRAWVNFNGQGTVSIRASGNVSSITDNGIGDYTVNFTNALPDANYATAVSQRRVANGTTVTFPSVSASASPATGSVRVANDGSGTTITPADPDAYYVVIVR